MNRRHFIGMAGAMCFGALMGVPCVCSASVREAYRESRALLGTIVDVSVADASSLKAHDAIGAAFDEAVRLDSVLSRFGSSTPLAELNRVGVLSDTPSELLHVVLQARSVNTLTRGAFNATVLPVVQYLEKHANKRGNIRLDRKELAEVRQLADPSSVSVSGSRIRLDKAGMGLTLDGIAKGYIADRMGAVLEAYGVQGWLVNAGGDIRSHGLNSEGHPWRIGVESPVSGGAYPTSFALRDGAVATSGSYRNRYDSTGSVSHLIAPDGVSMSDGFSTVSATVRAENAMRADSLATAFSVMGATDAVRLAESLPNCECFLVLRSGATLESKGWRA